VKTSGRLAQPAKRSASRLLLGLALLLALLVSGCTLDTGETVTANDLSLAGFVNPIISVGTAHGVSRVTVTVDTLRGPGTTNAQLASNLSQVSSIVWQQLPGHFDLLTMVVPGIGSKTITHAQLEKNLGARPAGLDSAPLTGQTHPSSTFLILSMVVLVLVAVVVFVLVARRQRKVKRRQTLQRNEAMISLLPPEVWGTVDPTLAGLGGTDGPPVQSRAVPGPTLHTTASGLYSPAPQNASPPPDDFGWSELRARSQARAQQPRPADGQGLPPA
jgi:hypothetical protein